MVKKILLIISIAVIALLMISIVTYAITTILCDCEVVSIGEHKDVLLKKCGEPNFKITLMKNENGQPALEQWAYKRENNRIYHVLINNGKIATIQIEDR